MPSKTPGAITSRCASSRPRSFCRVVLWVMGYFPSVERTGHGRGEQVEQRGDVVEIL